MRYFHCDSTLKLYSRTWKIKSLKISLQSRKMNDNLKSYIQGIKSKYIKFITAMKPMKLGSYLNETTSQWSGNLASCLFHTERPKLSGRALDWKDLETIPLTAILTEFFYDFSWVTRQMPVWYLQTKTDRQPSDIVFPSLC